MINQISPELQFQTSSHQSMHKLLLNRQIHHHQSIAGSKPAQLEEGCLAISKCFASICAHPNGILLYCNTKKDKTCSHFMGMMQQCKPSYRVPIHSVMLIHVGLQRTVQIRYKQHSPFGNTLHQPKVLSGKEHHVINTLCQSKMPHVLV